MPPTVRDNGANPETPSDQRIVPVRLPAADADSTGARKWVVLEAPDNLLIPRKLEQQGLAGYEPEALACFLASLGEADDGAVWDVGTNVGVYGLVARALTDRPVRGFEAVPDLASTATDAAVTNGLPYPVEAAALGAEPGEATFYLSDGSDTSNSLAAGFRPSSRSLTVPVDTLDEVVERTGEHPAVLKIDTETTEPDVLRGGAKTIAEHRPWILCEVLARSYCGPALMDVVQEWDYHWYHIKGEFPLAPADEIKGDNSAMMWLFAPEPPSPEFWDAAQRWRDRLAACGPAGPISELYRTRRELKAARKATKLARGELKALKTSATMEVGRIVTDVARRPIRGTWAAPRRAMRLWRSRRRAS